MHLKVKITDTNEQSRPGYEPVLYIAQLHYLDGFDCSNTSSLKTLIHRKCIFWIRKQLLTN